MPAPDRPARPRSSPSKPLAALWLLALFAFYCGAAVWLTWPLAADPSATLPCTSPACRFDTLYSAWALAWESHALATDPLRIGDANIYYPARDALYYGPAGFGALPYFAPTFLAAGSAALATNVMLWLCAAASALALHWVVRRWTGFESAGLVAAAVLLLQPWYLWGFVGATPHLAPLQYFPLILWLAASRLRSVRSRLVLVLLIVVQSLTDPVYVAAAVVAPLGLVVLARLARRRSRGTGLRLAAVLVVALLCLLPSLLGYLRVRAENPSLATQSLWQGWVAPSDLGSLFWRTPSPTTIAPAAAAMIVLGAALAIRRRLRGEPLPHDAGWRHGALWLLVGAWISLTPVAEYDGAPVYLPQYVLGATTPLYQIIRAPQRLGVAALIGACILCGVAVGEIARAFDGVISSARTRRFARGALAVAGVAALYLIRSPGTGKVPAAYPLQIVPKAPASFVAELRRGRGPIVQLPLVNAKIPRWPSSNWNAYAMYLSTSHWRPLLNGYSSYWPAGFIERMELAARLPDPAALAELARSVGLRAVWVDLIGYDRAQRLRWREAEAGRVPGLEFRLRDRSQLLFAVNAASAGLDEGAAPR